jgi:hypothetical protein
VSTVHQCDFCDTHIVAQEANRHQATAVHIASFDGDVVDAAKDYDDPEPTSETWLDLCPSCRDQLAGHIHDRRYTRALEEA